MLSEAELEVFKADIITNKEVIHKGKQIKEWLSESGKGKVAAYYNSKGEGNIWRPDITIEEVTRGIVMSDFIALSQGQRDAWQAMSRLPFIDATKNLVRNNIASIFGADTDTTKNFLALAQRKPTKFESLFTTSKVSSMYGYVVTELDIRQATLNTKI